MKVFGPYIRKDLRMHVVIQDEKGKLKTVSYPKYLVETFYKITLKQDETIDHIDRDFTNNKIDNLRIVPRSIHCKVDAKYVKYEPKIFKCPQCKKDFLIEDKKKLRYIIDTYKRNKVGPFCGKKCAGQYGAGVQNGKEKLSIKNPEINKTGYYLEK